MKPQDVLVALKLCVLGGRQSPYAAIAGGIGMSASEVHAAVARLVATGLMMSNDKWVVEKGLEEFLIHGLKYVFPAKLGGVVRGMPTSVGIPALSQELGKDSEFIPVWPDPKGEVRGYQLDPLYRSVPYAARQDQELYVLLGLADAIRSGGARERQVASDLLRRRLNKHA